MLGRNLIRKCWCMLAVATLVVPFVCAWAEDSVSFDVQPRVLKVGETATCRITVTGNQQAPAPSLPSIQGFQLAGTSQEQSFSVGPGGAQSSVSYVYQLSALEAGTFQIGPFGYRWNGKTYPLGPVEVSVVAVEADSNTGSRQEDFIFATLKASQPEAYVQQPLQLELSLYWHDLNIDREVALNGFDTTGLRLGGWQELQTSREAVRGQVYEVRRFRCQAIPLTAGSFTLSPQLRVQVLVRNSRSGSDPFFGGGAFDDMFFGRFRAQPTDVNVPPLALTIRDLPTEGRPPDFSGAVGQYHMDVQAQPQQVGVGEPVTLSVRISGAGNLDTVTAPTVAPSDDFRRYEPKLTAQDAAAGQKTFELVVIPKSASATNLPALSFSYFNPASGHYERADQAPIPLRVEGQSASTRIIRTLDNEHSTAPQTASGVDITHLKTTPPRWHKTGLAEWFSQPESRAVHVLPLLAFVSAWGIARHRRRLETDHAHARRREAPRSTRKALAEALRCLEREPAHRFFEALWQVLVSYFGNRFNLAPGEVNASEVSRRLLAGGWKVEQVTEVTRIFESCEGRRFGGGSPSTEPLPEAEQKAWRTQLDRLVELMRECERLP